jgi:ATP-binding protein involved in chromosome partitioning
VSSAATPVLAQVADIVAVHSAKGGVGKSTVAANLAVVFARLGMRVGLLDADVHGPSIAHMMGSAEWPREAADGKHALPLERHGVHYMSIANVAAEGLPIVWRGPMVAQAISQLLTQVDWGELDVLLVDMPPGTGDAVLGLGQTVPLAGVVTVTTPQELSLADTRRGIRAFEQLQVPVLGLVENMAGFVCDACGDEVALFGEGGGRRAAEQMGIAFLGNIPLVPGIGTAGDAGTPITAADPDSPVALAFARTASAVLARLAESGRSASPVDIAWRRMDPKEFRREPPRAAAHAPGRPELPATVWQAADDTLGILWADGETTFHGSFELRQACPCAGCVEEWTGRRMSTLDGVPRDVRPVTIRGVGRYALQPVWSDGHRTGLYPFKELRRGAGAVKRR